MTDNIDATILDLLVASQSHLSGQVIARRLNLSRTAVWKRIEGLREAGFHIGSARNRGYRLISLPDRLLPVLVKTGLKTRTVGSEIVYLPRTDSTNVHAKKLAIQGTANGTIVLTEYQSQGHGRLSRTWTSPFAENLLLSIIFYPPVPPSKVFHLTLLASLAVCRSLIDRAHIPAGIKWPNDVYVNHRKICGILTEFSAHQDRVNWAVVGIGLNVNGTPSADPDIKNIATSIRHESGSRHERLPLLQAILQEIDVLYHRFLYGDAKAIREEWLSNSIVLGKPVLITAEDMVEEGIAQTIDEDGALLMRTSTGDIRRIVYGDLSLKLKRET